MLRNVLVISDGGLVLFSREFVNAVAQPRLVGSLLTAMLEFSTNNVGAPVCYIEMSTIAVSIITSKVSHRPESSPIHPGLSRHRSAAASEGYLPGDHPTPIDRHEAALTTPKATPRRMGGVSLICALFHDVDDGPELGRLIATQLLHAFREQFVASLSKIGGGTPHINLNEFDVFHEKIPGILQGLVTPVLNKLTAHKGVIMSFIMTEESHIAHCSTEGIDGLGLGASLLALTNLANDAMGLRNDTFRMIVVESGESSRIVVRRLPYMKATLVVQCRTNINYKLCQNAIETCVNLLERLSCLL